MLARDEHAATWLMSAQRAPVEVFGDPKALAPPTTSPGLAFARPFVVGASTREGDETKLPSSCSTTTTSRTSGSTR